MAAYGAARTLVQSGSDASVIVLEKMPRPGRKIMLTGKGRCNFTNLKSWNDFSGHIRAGSELVKNAFFNFSPQSVIDFMEGNGMPSVVERGDRAYPASYHASDVVDTLVRACNGVGVKIVQDCEVRGISVSKDDSEWRFNLGCSDGGSWLCKKLIIATGGLSYPGTGSTGDGYAWAESFGHSITPLFPSLTALVPAGYKSEILPSNEGRFHIDRSSPLSETGKLFCGIQLKNIGATLLVGGSEAQSEFGDIYFTDGGIEGPIGFQLSRKAVKAMTNGSKVALVLDLKSGVEREELSSRVKSLWDEVQKDPRSKGLKDKEKCRILLGKLMPWDLIPAFRACFPGIVRVERRSRTETKTWVDLSLICTALKEWRFEIVGYVGYERAVVTAGGVSTSEISRKTMESRLVPGLYFCGEILDIDSDTGGYNLQTAFCSGLLAGESAAQSLQD